MLNSIGGDLLKSLGKAGISKQIEAVQVCDLWEKVICKIFGEQVVGQSQAMYFKDGVLAVAVLNPVLAQEFKFKEEEIKKEINQGRSDKIRKIRFEI
ncbi:MAG: DciA family protein [Candidatus Pacebacteria bacterium]|nr:DciA family protein [Candidatus Paceibacterota bacterium]